MQLAKCRNRTAHVTHPKRKRQCDTQRAAQLAVLLLNSSLRLFEVGQDARAVLIEAAARLGQIQNPRRTPQQLHTQVLFERRHTPADRRLGRIQLFRGRRKTACVHDCNKCLNILKLVHIVAFKRTILSSE